jgi:hypothetical protein
MLQFSITNGSLSRKRKRNVSLQNFSTQPTTPFSFGVPLAESINRLSTRELVVPILSQSWS